jgi:hypothetical protein
MYGMIWGVMPGSRGSFYLACKKVVRVMIWDDYREDGGEEEEREEEEGGDHGRGGRRRAPCIALVNISQN